MHARSTLDWSKSKMFLVTILQTVYAIVSACSLHVRPFRPQLSPRPRYTALQHRTALTLHYATLSIAAIYNDADDASPW